MSKDDTPDPRPDDVIDRLYEVAVDPSRYEALLDHWEAMIAPQRNGLSPGGTPILSLDQLAGHVERADQVLDRIVATETPKGPQAILGHIDRSAAFAVNRAMTVIATNTGATQLLNIRDGTKLSEMSLGDGDVDQLAHHIGRLLSSNRDETMVLRGRATDSERVIVFHLRVFRDEGSEPFVMVISSDIQWPAGFTDMLRAAFEFTPVEAQVVRALTEGQTLQEIADARSRSIDTIRTQLKSIMVKTETRSQTELVRLTLSTMEIAQFSETASDAAVDISQGYDSLEPRPFQTLSLDDGRRMDFLILGDPEGRPLVYSPLDYGLVRWPATAEAEATRRKIKVVVPVRAGYGQSTPLAKRTAYVPQLCDDYAALMDHLGIDEAPFLTLGGDTHLAALFNEFHPNRIRALIACPGVLPLTRPEQYDRMDKWHRFILAGARYTPHLLPFMVKAGFALARRLGKLGFLHAVYGKSEADMAAIENIDVLEALVVGSEVALSETHSAHDAFAREVIAHETTDWTESVLAFKDSIPVIMMNGLQDPQVPPETLAEYRRDYGWISFDVFPDGGQLLFFTKWEHVLNRIEPFLNET